MKRYTLEIEVDNDNRVSMSSNCEGFNPFELLGFLHWKIDDINKQIHGNAKPDLVVRTVTKDTE